jgi:hypothetical protein
VTSGELPVLTINATVTLERQRKTALNLLRVAKDYIPRYVEPAWHEEVEKLLGEVGG